MMGRRTITLLSLFLLASGPHSSFARQDQTPFQAEYGLEGGFVFLAGRG